MGKKTLGKAGIALSIALFAACVFTSMPQAQEGVVYSGEFDYPVPPVLVQKLSQYDNINNWLFFSNNQRWIDSNKDGVNDFIAISLGSDNGYGAQIRYYLFYRANSTTPELGSWYWFIIIDSNGNTIYETFNK